MSVEQTGQGCLDFEPRKHHRRRDADTSRDAAHSMQGGAIALAGKLLAALRSAGPMTRTEVAKIVGLSDYQTSKRLSDLKNASLIKDSGERRQGVSGRSQIVWMACNG